MTRRHRFCLTLVVGLVVSGLHLDAQSAPLPSALANARLATRPELESAAIAFDRLAASTAYSERTRANARAHAVFVRNRLAEGDFNIGDRIEVLVGGEVPFADTVTVRDDRRILLSGIREVSLTGILRSELQLKLRADVVEVVRNATVSARPMMRVAVFGSVTSPGYLSVPGETTVDELLTLSGGLVATAAADKSTIVRADTTLLTRLGVRTAIAEGRTLNALGLRDGDALVVPAQSTPWDRTATLSIVTLFLAPLIAIFAVGR